MKINFTKTALKRCQDMGLDINANDKTLEKEAARLIRKAAKTLLEASSLEVDIVDLIDTAKELQ